MILTITLRDILAVAVIAGALLILGGASALDWMSNRRAKRRSAKQPPSPDLK